MSSSDTLPFLILLIDDDPEWTDTICRLLAKNIPNGWKIVGVQPFEEKEQHIPWVHSHRVAAVLIDLKLNELLPNISYTGHDLVELFREKIPRLPRYYLTAHQSEAQVEDDIGDVDSIFDKRGFQRSPERNIQRVLRAARNYEQEHYVRIGRIADISKRAAIGTATPEELDEIHALMNVHRPVEIPVMQTRAKILEKAEALLERYANLLNDVRKSKEGE